MAISPDISPILRPGVKVEKLPLSPVEGFVLSRIDGMTPVKGIATGTGLPIEQVSAALEKLEKLGVIDWQRVETAKPRSRGAPREQGEVRVEAADLSLTLERVELLFKALGRYDYYRILGVKRAVDENEIKAAYAALSREYHPDRFYKIDLGARKEMVETVFARISEAYETLRDRDKRRSYDRSLLPDSFKGQDVAADAPKKSLVADAPRLVALAEQELRNGNFKNAAQNFKLAVALDPKDRELRERAELIDGLETLQQNLDKLNADPRSARVVAEKAVKPLLKKLKREVELLPPDDRLYESIITFFLNFDEDMHAARLLAETLTKRAPRPLYHMLLGRVAEKEGHNVEALKCFEKVLSLTPGNEEAKQAIRALKRKR